MKPATSFFNLYTHDYVRVAVAIPTIAVADPHANARRVAQLMEQAVASHAGLVVFPELVLSAYSCEDLFHQSALLDQTQGALLALVDQTRSLPLLAAVGVPLAHQGALYNCIALIGGGKIHGIVPKTYLPNYREYYEARHFVSADALAATQMDLPGHPGIPFSAQLIFQAQNQPRFRLGMEICEDLWVPIPPSSYLALAGATVIANASASNASIAKEGYRRQLVSNQSARTLSAYLYSASGAGESTTDLAWDGQGMIADYGEIKAEATRFAQEDQLILADIDLLRLEQERMRQNTFWQSVERHQDQLISVTTVPVTLPLYAENSLLPLLSPPPRYPYVPSGSDMRHQRCADVLSMQVQGLATRLKFTGLNKLVIGISGGLDSTLALLVAVRTLDQLKLPRSHLLAYALPGFATSSETLERAHALMKALGVSAFELDIRPSSEQMLKDIGHPHRDDSPAYDITYENVQAGERTSHLFRLANLHGALVVGTSDLSELALGWSTYGVGDHMAHYHVNASVPKTLVQYLIDSIREQEPQGSALATVLHSILVAEITPELVPGAAVQRTEDTVGPYPLQDFTLYQILRFGFAPPRVAFMAWCAWHNAAPGSDNQTTYGIAEIRKWLEVFVKRFFQGSQFKRSCIANSPKIGSGGSLSPRGDWRAPSDGLAAPWLQSMATIPETEPRS
jgi:NAD+ synthase (glutamine-hydrolysing)